MVYDSGFRVQGFGFWVLGVTSTGFDFEGLRSMF
jgi:hypothetical protein